MGQGRRTTALAVAVGLVWPAAAEAWQVTVRVHGAGQVRETTDRRLMDCTTPLHGTSESTVTGCVAGTPSGGYQSFDVVRLLAAVPADAYARGWRFTKWVDSRASGRINCDPQDRVGDHFDTVCQFQIFEDLSIDLFFGDVAAPETTRVSGPGTPTRSTSATFAFSSPEGDARFECRLHRPGSTGAWWLCGGPSDPSETVSGLGDGQHVMEVRALDPSGNRDGTPASWSWTVDTVAPTVTHLTGPPARTTGTDARFTWSTSEASTGEACWLDGAALGPCDSGLQRLVGEGAHELRVQATDAAGNTGPVASWRWEVDRTGPATALAGGPTAATSADTATFELTSPAADHRRFECRLERPGDPGVWSTCTSPRTYTALGDGTYAFSARSVDDLGNTGPAVQRSWSVDRTAPETTITEGPDDGAAVEPAPVRFAFTAGEPADFACAVDGGAPRACTSPYTVAALAPGRHELAVVARDAVGNADASPARRAFVVLHPDADRDGARADVDCRDDDPAVRPGATDVPGDGVDQDCSGADAAAGGGDGGTGGGDGGTGGGDGGTGGGESGTGGGAGGGPGQGAVAGASAGAAVPSPPAAPVVTPAPRAAVVGGVLTARWRAGARSARAVALRLRGLARGTEVRVRCRGAGCAPARRVVAPASGRVDLRRLLRGRTLRAGAVLTIELRAAGRAAKVLTFTGRTRRAPVLRTRCRPPGATMPTAC